MAVAEQSWRAAISLVFEFVGVTAAAVILLAVSLSVAFWVADKVTAQLDRLVELHGPQWLRQRQRKSKVDRQLNDDEYWERLEREVRKDDLT